MRLGRSAATPPHEASAREGERPRLPLLPSRLRGARDLVGRKLRWAEVKSELPTFVLSDEQGPVGSLAWVSRFTSHAVAADAGGEWTLEPTGLAGRPLVLRGGAWGPEGARAEGPGRANLRLVRPGFPPLRWSGRDWLRRGYFWAEEDGTELLRLLPRRFGNRFRGTAPVKRPPREDTVPLVLLGIYLAYFIRRIIAMVGDAGPPAPRLPGGFSWSAWPRRRP